MVILPRSNRIVTNQTQHVYGHAAKDLEWQHKGKEQWQKSTWSSIPKGAFAPPI
jgi:hypothetical protein